MPTNAERLAALSEGVDIPRFIIWRQYTDLGVARPAAERVVHTNGRPGCESRYDALDYAISQRMVAKPGLYIVLDVTTLDMDIYEVEQPPARLVIKS